MAGYLMKKKLIQRQTASCSPSCSEPLELCTRPATVRRIREYEHVFDKRMSVEECLRVADEADAPSSISRRRAADPQGDRTRSSTGSSARAGSSTCTNGMLMDRAFGKIPPSADRFAFVVHLTVCARSVHDHAVDRKGAFDKATAHARGHPPGLPRAPTRPFTAASRPRDVRLFLFLREMGIESCITSPGFRLRVGDPRPGAVPGRQGEAEALYTDVHDRCADPSTSASTAARALSTSSCRQARVPLLGLVTDADLHRRGRWRSPCRLYAAPTATSASPASSLRGDRTGRPTARARLRGKPPTPPDALRPLRQTTIIEAPKKPKDLVALAPALRPARRGRGPGPHRAVPAERRAPAPPGPIPAAAGPRHRHGGRRGTAAGGRAAPVARSPRPGGRIEASAAPPRPRAPECRRPDRRRARGRRAQPARAFA